MVSGALGVAVIGSLVSSLYSNDVEGSLGGLPAQAQAGAEDSIGAANAIAAQLPPEAASDLLATTGDAFTQAMGTGLLVAAALAAAAAVVVARFLPAREPVAGEAEADARAAARSPTAPEPPRQEVSPMMPRIEDYALLGDTHTAALVSGKGSIDWLCLPRFDSAASFAALLGDQENGRWQIAPDGHVRRLVAGTAATRSFSRRTSIPPRAPSASSTSCHPGTRRPTSCAWSRASAAACTCTWT